MVTGDEVFDGVTHRRRQGRLLQSYNADAAARKPSIERTETQSVVMCDITNPSHTLAGARAGRAAVGATFIAPSTR